MLADAGADEGCMLEIASFDSPLDGTFDVVVALESLVHARDLAATIAQIAGVLRPGGLLVIIEDLWKDQSHLLPRYFYEGWGVSRLMTRSDVTCVAERAGLETTVATNLSDHVITIGRAVHSSVSLILSLGAVVPGLRSSRLIGFYRAQLYLHTALQRGQLEYAMLVARRPTD